MQYDGFSVVASPHIINASCKKCHGTLKEVDNGWLSTAMFCPKCESVFILKLIKMPNKKISEDFLKQCREQANIKT